MATLTQLEKALVNADKAGDMDAARKLTVVIKAERARLGDTLNIPGTADFGDVPGTVPEKPSESLGQKVKGAGEAALSVVTAIPAAIAGGAAGMAKGIKDQIVTGGHALDNSQDVAADLADKVASAMTYQPRTETGGQILETVGKVAEPLMALGPMAAELGAVGEAAAAARPVLRTAAAEATTPIKQAVVNLTEKVAQKLAPGAKVEAAAVEAPKPYSPVTAAEAAHIREYQNGASINGYLRDATDTGPHEFVSAQAKHRLEEPGVKAQLEALDSSIAKNVVPEDMVLYRGANKILAKLPEDGKTFTDPAFVATSTDPQIGSAFGDLIRIKVPKGTPVLDVNKALGEASRYTNQKEMILPRGLKFKAGTDSDGVRTLEVVSDKKPTAGTGTSGGAAAVDMADVRRANAEELGFTGDKALTQGQATRSFEQQRFERETAKQGDIGEPIRQRMANQNLHLQQKLDEFIDSTGAELTETRDIGGITDKALRQRAARDKVKVRALFKDFEKSDEFNQKIDAKSVRDFLVSQQDDADLAPVVNKALAKLDKLAANNYFGRGDRVTLTLGEMAALRKTVTAAAKADINNKNNLRVASEIKRSIDSATEGKGGELYKKANAAHAQMMADYENFGLAKQLLGLKRGSSDRALALEDVLHKAIISPSASVDSVTKLNQLLITEGETGQQALKELQGGTLRYIRDEALKGVSRDTAGNQIVSAAGLDRAVTALDKTGKLEAILGKQQANRVRLINDVAKDVFTSPPGAVNTSNTATVLAGLLDVAATGMAGVPVPVATTVRWATSRIKDAKLKARVKAALGE